MDAADYRDMSPETERLIDDLQKHEPIWYGDRIVRIRYEAGKRMWTRVSVEREHVEKFRQKAYGSDTQQ